MEGKKGQKEGKKKKIWQTPQNSKWLKEVLQQWESEHEAPSETGSLEDGVTDYSDDSCPNWAMEFSNKLSRIIKKQFEDFRLVLHQIKADIMALINRVEETEQRISNVEDEVHRITNDEKEKNEKLTFLLNKIEDLENRSRRNNLRLTGIPETTDMVDTMKVVKNVLGSILQIEPESSEIPEVERAHRSLKPKPNKTDRPQQIIFKFLRSADKDKVLRAARGKGELQWEGTTFRLAQDFSSSVQQKRAEYRKIWKIIESAGGKPLMLYPARLRISLNGQKLEFQSVSEAEGNLKKHVPQWFFSANLKKKKKKKATGLLNIRCSGDVVNLYLS
uniref:L1 transposable element RRM domain-containing protein n=1 Tax=Latimeria chalumnae TaxID=7897 RepID=H3AKR2_LATCH